MSVKCQVIIDALERLAPRYLAEEWDNVGLLIGSPAQEVHKIFVCLDVTEAALEAACSDGVDLIVAHHPLIFKPMKELRTDRPDGRLIAGLVRAGIAVYAAHTNLDAAAGGVNDVLAGLIGLSGCEPLAVGYREELVKLVVFVPPAHAQDVKTAIFKAGAGHIGAYSHTAFQTEGMGEFLPLTGTHPYIGQPGIPETTPEVRIETILPARISGRVVRAMLRAHPYEEAAYDLYPLKNTGRAAGVGRIGKLNAPVSVESLAQRVKAVLPTNAVRVAGDLTRQVEKVAVCGGSGAEFIGRAAFAGADAYVTGDVKYHEAQRALDAGLVVIDAGHFGTEMPIAPVLQTYLTETAAKEKWRVEVLLDTLSRDIFSAV